MPPPDLPVLILPRRRITMLAFLTPHHPMHLARARVITGVMDVTEAVTAVLAALAASVLEAEEAAAVVAEDLMVMEDAEAEDLPALPLPSVVRSISNP